MFSSLKLSLLHYSYRLARPLLFLMPSEMVHEYASDFGAFLGRQKIAKKFIQSWCKVSSPILYQKIAGISFENPVGLAAGFDYEAKLTQILPAIGFGFGTVGTITQKSYGGNPSPMLGRLVKSQSLMVNKGFKNLGIHETLRRLENKAFAIPAGLSIGKTNQREAMTQEEAVADIIASFKVAESSSVPFSYYELNISCPNLYGSVDFYAPNNLRELLAGVSALNLKKPLFIKMPISVSDEQTKEMLAVILNFKVQGIILGNLQKDRTNSAIKKEELAKYSVGNFSGKPTQKRSDELIALAYKICGQKLVIIGCGGIFSAEDAYKKIKLGASLVQLVTGLVYVGPQLPAEVNLGLIDLLKKDGYQHISQAVGVNVK